MRKYKIGNMVFLANGRWEAWVLAYRLGIENPLVRRLMPEEIPQETVVQILKGNRGETNGV